MITVCAVEWGNYLGRAEQYIATLRSMVARHLKQPHRFVALELDAPAEPISPTCWPKMEIFRPGRFEGRVLYLDLDSVIVGSLDELVRHKGAVHLIDWGWPRNVHAGGTLVFDVEEEGARIWEAFTPDVPRSFETDQEWMTSLGVWDRLPPQFVRSFRYHCGRGAPPPGASVIAFHGPEPKPHEILDGWVASAWKC